MPWLFLDASDRQWRESKDELEPSVRSQGRERYIFNELVSIKIIDS